MHHGYEGNPFDEPGLITKLGSINAMIERASTSGEREAAEGARDRILSRLLLLGVAPETADKKAKKQRDDAAAPRNRPRRPPPEPTEYPRQPSGGRRTRTRARPRSRPSYARPKRPSDDFDIPSDLSPKAKKVAKVIVKMAVKEFGPDTSGGGSRAFYSPEEWKTKEGTHLESDVILIVVHDGGDMSQLFNFQYLGLIFPAMVYALAKLDVEAWNQSPWYTFIQENEPVRRPRTRRPAARKTTRAARPARPAAPRPARRKAAGGDPFAGKKKVKKSDLRVGQKVFFRYRSELMTGKITKLNPKTVNLVQTNNMKQYEVDAGEEWNISSTELRV